MQQPTIILNIDQTVVGPEQGPTHLEAFDTIDPVRTATLTLGYLLMFETNRDRVSWENDFLP